MHRNSWIQPASTPHHNQQPTRRPTNTKTQKQSKAVIGDEIIMISCFCFKKPFGFEVVYSMCGEKNGYMLLKRKLDKYIS
jgi:hypothetical protein